MTLLLYLVSKHGHYSSKMAQQDKFNMAVYGYHHNYFPITPLEGVKLTPYFNYKTPSISRKDLSDVPFLNKNNDWIYQMALDFEQLSFEVLENWIILGPPKTIKLDESVEYVGTIRKRLGKAKTRLRNQPLQMKQKSFVQFAGLEIWKENCDSMV